jgi:hypothetical protein
MRAKRFFTLLALVSAAQGQSFNVGSTSADGALVLTTPGTIIFDPRTFNPPLNPAGDNVYHFTSVYIGKEVTVKLSSKIFSGPVFWLSQGPVQIDGVLDLSGDDGGRTPSTAGAGGFPGGVVRRSGYGPSADYTPNIFLVPLMGGSGGNGGETHGGGAGGGALLIASSTSIMLNGEIRADGGSSIDGSGGCGGAIRLVAPLIAGSGAFSAKGGQPDGCDGRVRLEAFTNDFAGSSKDTPAFIGKPFGLFLPPAPAPSVRVVSVGGVPLAGGEFTNKQPSRITVVVEARNVPTGTHIDLEFFAENGTESSITTTALEGTFELSRASALVTFPSGRSRAYVKATWKQPDRKQ